MSGTLPAATDAAPTPFTMLGDPSAVACEGDACELPASVAEPVEAPRFGR